MEQLQAFEVTSVNRDCDVINVSDASLSLAEGFVGLVADRLKELLSGQGALDQVLDYLMERQGKMVRPSLVYLSAQLCGGANQAVLLDVATGVEMIHLASLVHDDIIDKSDMRRGQRTVQALYGPDVAVLTGDFLFATAFSLFSHHYQTGVLAEMTRVIREMCAGEVRQLISPGSAEPYYWHYIYCKTASLIGGACQTGALVAQADSATTKRMEEIGVNLGYAFQIIDDILDYTGTDQVGKPKGMDFAEGLWTLPIIRGVQRGVVSDTWAQDYSFSEIRTVLARHFVFQDCQREAEEFIERACKSLKNFAESAERTELTKLAQYIGKRQL